MKSVWVLSVAVLCSGCSGSHEPAPSASVKEFQEYYSGTKWYWSDVIALPTAVPGYKPMDVKRGSQVHLISDDEKRLIRYTEMEHRTGMKTFYGPHVLEAIDGVDAPLFGVVGKSNMFIGFFDGRLCRIEVVNWGENPNRVQRDVVALGLDVLAAAQNHQRQRGIEPDGPANGSQPIRSETNRTSVAAGSDR
jgi:hypothetical protein